MHVNAGVADAGGDPPTLAGQNHDVAAAARQVGLQLQALAQFDVPGAVQQHIARQGLIQRGGCRQRFYPCQWQAANAAFAADLVAVTLLYPVQRFALNAGGLRRIACGVCGRCRVALQADVESARAHLQALAVLRHGDGHRLCQIGLPVLFVQGVAQLCLQRLQLRLPAVAALAAVAVDVDLHGAAALLHLPGGAQLGMGQTPLHRKIGSAHGDGSVARPGLLHGEQRRLQLRLQLQVLPVVAPAAAPVGMEPCRAFQRAAAQKLHAGPGAQPLAGLAQIAHV